MWKFPCMPRTPIVPRRCRDNERGGRAHIAGTTPWWNDLVPPLAAPACIATTEAQASALRSVPGLSGTRLDIQRNHSYLSGSSGGICSYPRQCLPAMVLGVGTIHFLTRPVDARSDYRCRRQCVPSIDRYLPCTISRLGASATQRRPPPAASFGAGVCRNADVS